MDIRHILGKLDTLTEGTMSSAKKKPTGPKFVGKMKGTDPASAAKTKYVGGESILRDLEQQLAETTDKRDLFKEFREFKTAEPTTEVNPVDTVTVDIPLLIRLFEYSREDAKTDMDLHNVTERMIRLSQGGRALTMDDYDSICTTQTNESFSDYDRAVMEGGHSLEEAVPVPPAQPNQPNAQKPPQPNQPTLGADLTKPAAPVAAATTIQQQQAAQKAAQQDKIQQTTLQKGVTGLKAAGGAVNNPQQVVTAFNKVDNQQALTPADKNSIASAGTSLAPIMSNPQLQGKFKDLVNQASLAQKKQQQPAQPGQLQ